MEHNKEAIQKTIDTLKKHEDLALGFSIASYKTDVGCGTVACIAGWIVFADSPIDFAMAREALIPSKACDIAGLTEDEAYELFLPSLPFGISWGSVTPEHAVKVLEHLRDTGEVDWMIIENNGERSK